MSISSRMARRLMRAFVGPAYQGSTVWTQPLEVLRKKWHEVPTTRSGRRSTAELLKLLDGDLLAVWNEYREDVTTGSEFSHRGWYHLVYADMMRGKKVLDVGSGLAVDSITFAQHGAKVTFVDLVESNLNVVERLCGLMGIEDATYLYLETQDCLRDLGSDYDVIMAMGSLHHAPVSVVKPEVAELLKHLKKGGRWLQLAYPKTRWLREGEMSFDRWGERTDGEGTPWAEYYDLNKLLEVMSPHRFDVVLCQEFHKSNFIWFDLLYRG